jgi:hypothetical protein
MHRALSALREIEAIQDRIAQTMPDNPQLAGWASYAQCDEDGIIRECLRRLGRNTQLSQTFVEIGCSNGLENNTHQLVLDGFRGVWVDGASECIDSLKEALGQLLWPRLWVLQALVGLDNNTALAQRMADFLAVASVDFLSLDIDGNDLHVIPAFIAALTPKLICVEYNAKFPPPSELVIDYNDQHHWAYDDYYGASLQAWVTRLNELGYTLVCCNASGANAFFVQQELLQGFTTYPVEQLYQPSRYALVDYPKSHRPSLKWLKQVLQQPSDNPGLQAPSDLTTLVKPA